MVSSEQHWLLHSPTEISASAAVVLESALAVPDLRTGLGVLLTGQHLRTTTTEILRRESVAVAVIPSSVFS